MAPHPLLHRLFDYAGLFPPAALALDAAVATFVRHRAGPEAALVARFVVPLAHADALAARLPADLPTTLAVLATPLDPGADAAAAASTLSADLDRLAALLDAHPALAADALEVRPPDAVLASEGTLRTYLAAADAARVPGLRLAVEVPWARAADTWPGVLAALAGASGGAAAGDGAVLKLRTGGLVPEAFPSPHALAAALAAAHAAGVPFKATAGLHHPLPSVRGGLPMHGFLGVFGGAALVHAGALGPADLPALLADAAPATALRLDPDGGIAWNGARADARAVAAARQAFALSIGSCSIDEPVEDLRALGVPGEAFGVPAGALRGAASAGTGAA